LREIGGYGFLIHHDTVGERDVTTRPDGMLGLAAEIAAQKPGLPMIALQHNPIFPDVDSTAYPYMPTNTAAIRRAYRDAGVVLSISGHYHPGQSLQRAGGVAYYTAPAACERPFRFAVVTLAGREVEVEEFQLELHEGGLVDAHCHTELAYCGEDITAGQNVALSRLCGVSALCLVEHAFQLYFDNEIAWSYRWKHDRALVEGALAGRGTRMEAYRSLVRPLRGAAVFAGLEVDLAAGGGLLLAEADRGGWDLLVGAVHALTGPEPRTDAEADLSFLREVESLLLQPIDVLAHPFRWFRRSKRERPVHLYAEVARQLAAAGVAAEINYHTNDPDPRFFEECLQRGVKLALGSDAHNRAEVGELYPHVTFLKKLGVTDVAAQCFRCASSWTS
jgi:histidinol phosphatase-like PHP family hydrolase